MRARPSPTTQTLATIISFPLVIALGLLLGWHIYLVAYNKTTIEYHEGVRSRTKGGHRVGKHIYDLGMFENPHSILGVRVYWFARPVLGNVEGVVLHVTDSARASCRSSLRLIADIRLFCLLRAVIMPRGAAGSRRGALQRATGSRFRRRWTRGRSRG